MNSSAFPGHPLIWGRMEESIEGGFARGGELGSARWFAVETLIRTAAEAASNPVTDSVR